MILFPQNPVWFSLMFIKAMRNHEKCTYKPSIRQAIAICKLILSRFLNRGMCETEDFIDIAVITSPLENQDLARTIAEGILTYSESSDNNSQKDRTGAGIFDSTRAKDLVDELSNQFDELDEIYGDFEFLNKYVNEIQDLDINLLAENPFTNFFDKFREQIEKDPYKSALDVIDQNTITNFEKFPDLKSLLDYAKEIIRNKINNLEPQDINFAKKLGMLDEIISKSNLKREIVSSQLAKIRDLSKQDLKNSLQNNLYDALNIADFALKSKALDNKGHEIVKEHLKKNIIKSNRNIDDLFNASKILGSNLNIEEDKLEKIIKNSLDLPFKEAYQSVKDFDQYFGGNLSEDYLKNVNEKIAKADKKENLENMRKELINNPIKVPQWRKLMSNVIDKEISIIKGEYDKNSGLSAQMKNFSDKLIASRVNCSDFMSKTQFDNKIQDVVNQTTELSMTKDQLRNFVKDFNKIGFLPNIDTIKQAGRQLKMSEAEILNLIETNYKYLKQMVQDQTGNYQSYRDYLKQLNLSPQQVEELFKIAMGPNPPQTTNMEAISALNEKHLTEVMNHAQRMGDKALDTAFSCLGAGNGLDLLEQWFYSRHNVSSKVKSKLKEIIKHIMIDLGIRSANNLIGSASSGPIVENIVIPYTEGDEFELIDLEETIDNLLVGGKSVEIISNDDFLVSRTTQGLRCLVLELDISGSMTGRKLSQMALCATMLVYAFKPEELALTFFESNTHRVKDLDQDIELENVVDELLDITARGGTRINSALKWANHQFEKKARSKHKLNILFTDADVYDYNNSLKELKKLCEKDVKFVMVVPKFNYSPVMAKKMVDEANGVLLTLNQWRDFPKLISDIISGH
ncbi:MAG: VWA domain-containing protein [Candidatus Thorarchaeota archaeon]